MERSELVELITQEVLRKLSGKNSAEGPAESRSERLLILTGGGCPLRAGTRQALEERFLCTWQDREAACAAETRASDFDRLLAAGLSNGQLASAALGVPYGAEARPLVEALCAGRPVAVIEEGVAFMRDGCQSAGLRKLYAGYLETLVSFGAAVVPESGLAEFFGAETRGTEAAAPRGFDGRVLTEAEARKCAAFVCKGRLSVGPRTLVTPLAADFLRGAGIEVVKKEVRSGLK